MHVETINRIEDFEHLRDTWETVHAADPHATVFTLWSWLRGWIKASPLDWLVLAVRPDLSKPYVAFVALSLQPVRKSRVRVTYHLKTAGYPFSDRASFICLPDYVSEAIPALASYIKKQIKWERIELKNIFDPRLDLFLQSFSGKKVELKENDATLCHYILLPDKWDQYLLEFLGYKTRKTLKKEIRNVENLHEFHVTEAGEETLASQMETLFALWSSRWQLKDDDMFMGYKTSDVFNIFRTIFRSCLENNNLCLRILWQDTRPIAGLIAFTDKEKKLFVAYMTAYNSEFLKFSPGSVMMADSIRYAVENGYRVFDFGGGDEKYKLSFGAEKSLNRNIIVSRGRVLDDFKEYIPQPVRNFCSRLLRG